MSCPRGPRHQTENEKSRFFAHHPRTLPPKSKDRFLGPRGNRSGPRLLRMTPSSYVVNFRGPDTLWAR